MRIAVYPGSFDPITNGHIDIIERAAKIFDSVYVAVIGNPSKATQFSSIARVDMIKKTTDHIKNISVECFDGLLINYVKSKNAKVIIRGLRAVSDFDYEFQMALTNNRMCEEIETMFLMTDFKYSYLSSSLVKQIALLGGDIAAFVPSYVEKKIKEA